MKPFHFLFAVFLIANFSHANDQKLFERALDDVNTAIAQPEINASCPGLDTVVSCGNGVCESRRGENETTCGADCVPALIKSYNNQTLCRGVTRVFQPASIAEVQNIIRETKLRGENLRIVGRLHSANEQLCNVGAVISTEKLTRIIALEQFNGQDTVLAEAGVTLYQLSEWLHERNRSLGFITIGFRDVSIAGAAATGSHGSSPRHSAVVSSSVESLSIVNSDGELKEYSRSKTDPTTWKALTANLGMAGAVVQMRLRVQPQFNLDMKVTYHSESDLFKKGGVGKLVERCDFALINWFPGTDRFMRSCGMKTTKKENTGANNVLLDPGLPKFAVNPFKKVLQYGACNNAVACMIEKVRYLYFKLRPPFATIAKNGKRSYKKHLIGPSHRMMSSHLTSYQKGLAQMDWEVVVPLNQIEPAMKAVRSIVDQHNLCLPLVGVFIRFGIAEDTSLLAHSVALGSFKAGDMVAFIEIPSYIPTGFTDHRRALYDLPYEEFTRKLIEEFNGRPHWGKNREWAFVRAQELDVYGVNRAAFQSTMRAMDPQGMFVNDWAKLVLFD